MKVLIVQYPYFGGKSCRGGDDVVFSAIASALSPCHQVHFYSYNSTYRRLAKRLPDSILKLAKYLEELVLPYLVFLSVMKVQHEYDVVVADSSALSPLWMSKNELSNVFSVVNIHYKTYLRLNKCWILGRQHLKLFFKITAQNRLLGKSQPIAVSKFVEKSLLDDGVKNVVLIENYFYDDILFPLKNIIGEGLDAPKLLFVGGADFYGKGGDILEGLCEKGFNITAITVGKLRVSHCLPPMKHSELINKYQEFDIFIFPSRYESFGLVILEALACGLPVLMSKTGIGCEIYQFCPDFIIDCHDGMWIEQAELRITMISNNYIYYSRLAVDLYNKLSSNGHGFTKKWRDCVSSVAS